MAKDGGLEKLYILMYGFMSALAHGNVAASFLEPKESFVVVNLTSKKSLLEALHRIVVNRVRNHQVTTVREIADILKLPEVANGRAK